MDSRTRTHDISRSGLCELCEIGVVQVYCTFCFKRLCRDCQVEHTSVCEGRSSRSGYHFAYPQCQTHNEENYEMHCHDCNTPVCPKCINSEIHKKHLLRSFKDHDYIMNAPENVSCPLHDEPELINSIDTEHVICSVSCLNDEEIWTTRDRDYKTIKLSNLQGTLLKSIKTETRTCARDIAVTKSGDLVYTEPDARTVNIVKNNQIQEVIRLQGWTPHYICSTSSGDLLVTMISDDNKQSKVVLYSGSTEKQTIQFYKGKPLYSNGYVKYIAENKNRDICVADFGAYEVVVVNKEGELRFRYRGRQFINKTFRPYGITTDSQSHILLADRYHRSIHILNQDGQFLRYIDVDKCYQHEPYGLCVDSRDNLFVGCGRVKIIRCVDSSGNPYDSWGIVKKFKYK